MSINLSIYDETSKMTQSVTIDFLADFGAFGSGTNPNEMQYFFKIITYARDTEGLSYGSRYVTKLSDLALNKQKRSSANSAVEYEDIKTMVQDYVYDMIYGHTANQYSSGCAYKAPMSFT